MIPFQLVGLYYPLTEVVECDLRAVNSSLEWVVVFRQMHCPKVHGLALPMENRPGNQWVGDNGGRLVGGLKS